MGLIKKDVICNNIKHTTNVINMSSASFIPTESDICNINLLNIILHSVNIFYTLNYRQRENMIHNYNNIIIKI